MRVSSPVFVGRRVELDAVAAVLQRAAGGELGVVLVGGEAGVGKTRFSREVSRIAEARGWQVLEGGCVQVGDGGLPYGPFVEALRGLLRRLPATEVDRLVGAGRPELARLLPSLHGTEAASPYVTVLDASAQGRLFEHILLLLERHAASAPVLLIVEDAHWADRSTIDVLRFLIRNVRDVPVLLLVTFRSDELHRRHPLMPFLAEQERAGRALRLELPRFERDEVAAQLAGILGEQPGPRLVESILSRSQGNAFYAEELLAAAPGSTGRIPATIRDVLLARVFDLTEATQAIVRTAAAGGSRIAADVLTQVAGVPLIQVEDALAEAITHQILVATEGGSEHYAFRHALVQEAVYDQLLGSERTRLHAAFADALARDAKTDAGRAAQLAYHHQAANDHSGAFDAWINAGLAAESIYAFAEAAADYERALALWDRVPDAETRAPIDRVDLLVRAAEVAEGSAPERSVDYIKAALALVDPATFPVRAGLLYERLGHNVNDLWEEDASRRAYETAVRLVPGVPATLERARVLSGLGTWLFFNDQPRDAVAMLEDAVRTAAEAGGHDIRALPPLGTALVGMGQVERGLDTLREAERRAADAGLVYDVARAKSWHCGALFEAGRDEAALESALAAVAYATEHGLAARWASLDLVLAAEVHVATGRLDAAQHALAQATRLDLAGSAAIVVDIMKGYVRALVGTAGDDVLDRPTDAGLIWSPFRGPAEFLLANERPRDARTVLARHLAPFADRPAGLVRSFGCALWYALRAEADIATGRQRHDPAVVAEARELGRRLRDRVASMVEEISRERPYYLEMAQRWASLCEAEWTRVAGAPDPDAWASAAEVQVEPYVRAYARWREGEAALLGPRPDRPRAATALAVANNIAAEIGAAPLREAIALLRPQAERPSTNEPAHPGAPSLTNREREILELLAQGRSDGEIGASLFISPKTASVHVANIKAKLGAASRVEIVISAIALGLVEAPISAARSAE